MATATHPVDEMLPAPKLFTLGLQHVLVMYAGAIAVPLIIGRVLQLPPEDVAFLISADLFCCGVVSILQSLGFTRWFGVRMPVMMGVTFASVGPMVSIALTHPGAEGARMIFGSIIAAGIIGVLIAPIASRMLRFFPPVVTGTIILVIGITLMRVGINWIFGVPVGPTAPHLVSPEHTAWLEQVTALGGAVPPPPRGLRGWRRRWRIPPTRRSRTSSCRWSCSASSWSSPASPRASSPTSPCSSGSSPAA